MPNYDLGTAEGKIVLDTSGVDNAVNDANRSMGRLGKGVVNAERIGRDLTTGITLPLVAAGGYALKTAIDFETAFAGVTKTVNGTEAEIAGLRQGIIDMSQRIPASTTEIAAVAEAAGQLGVAVEDIEEFTEVMIALGVSTNLTSDVAANSIARITNIMGTGVGELGNFGAALVDLGNNSATTEAEILEMANRIAGIANLSGASEAEMLSLAAALSAVGVRAESGGTSVTKTIKDFDEFSVAIKDVDGNMEELDSKAKAFFDLMGGQKEFEAFDKLTGVQQYEVFIQKLQETEAGGGNLIAILKSLGLQEIRQSDAILRMVGAGDLLSDTIKIGNVAWEESTALTTEASKRYATTASQLQIVRNKADNAARIFGEALLPILIDLLDGITPLIEGLALAAEWFARLPDPVRRGIVTFLGLAAALGPVIFIGARIVRTIGAFISIFKLLGIALTLNPIVLVIAAIAALIVGFVLLYKRSEKFRNFINNLGKEIQAAWKAVIDFFKRLPEIFSGVWEKIKAAFNSAKDAVVGAWGDVIEFFSGIGSAIEEAFDKAVAIVHTFVTTAIDEITGFFKKLPGIVSDGVSRAFSAFVDFLKELPEIVAYWLGFVIGRVLRFYYEFYTTIYKTGYEVVKAVVNFMNKLPGIVFNFLREVVERVISFGVDVVSEIVRIGTEIVVWMTTKLTEFAQWLPGFLLGVLMQFITWGQQLLSWAWETFVNVLTTIIGILADLPGDVANIILQIITSFPGWAADFASGAWNMGVEFVAGLVNGIGDLVGLVKNMVTNAINGVGDLGSTAYNKMKDIGSSMWNGFKDGLGISSPSFIEEAAFTMRANLSDVINSLGSQVREMQHLGRTLPNVSQTDRFGQTTLAAVSSGATGGSAGAGVASVGGVQHHYHAPLVGEATIRRDDDIYALANDLEYEQKRRNRGKGGG